MESKLWKRRLGYGGVDVLLIETVWNRNSQTPSRLSCGGRALLIEPVWNRNKVKPQAVAKVQTSF